MSLPMLFAAAFGVAFSGALMPGPVLFATVRWSARHGRWTGPLIVLGHVAVEIPLMTAVVLGLGATLRAPAFAGVAGLAGGALLLAMGAMMIRSAPRSSLPAAGAANARQGAAGALKIVAAGALTSVSNPYFAGWWATVGLQFLSQAAPFGLAGYAVFYAGHVLADFAWYCAASESVHRGRRLLSDRSYRRLIAVCGVVMLVLGALFAYWGYAFLAGARQMPPR